MKTYQNNTNPADNEKVVYFETFQGWDAFELSTEKVYTSGRTVLTLVDLDIEKAVQLRNELEEWIESYQKKH